MATAEATAEFVVKENVPIFHECVSLDKDGNPEPITAEMIDHIADVNNARIVAGEPAVIHVGHTDGSDNEKPVLGFLDKYTTGLREVDGKQVRTLFANYRVYPEKESELRYYPRRSVEIYHASAPESKRWVITSLALVGSNEPALKLGVMYRAQDQQHLAKFTIQAAEPGNVVVPDELKAQILDVLMATDIAAWCRERMVSKAEVVNDMPNEPDKNTDPDADKKPEGDEPDGDEKTGDDKGDEKVADDDKADKDAEKYTALKSELEDMKRKFTAVNREKRLNELEHAGHVFNVAEELTESADESDAMFEKRVGLIQKFTKRAPIGHRFNVAEVTSGGNTSAAALPAKIQKIQTYAREHSCSFEVAEAACN